MGCMRCTGACTGSRSDPTNRPAAHCRSGTARAAPVARKAHRVEIGIRPRIVVLRRVAVRCPLVHNRRRRRGLGNVPHTKTVLHDSRRCRGPRSPGQCGEHRHPECAVQDGGAQRRQRVALERGTRPNQDAAGDDVVGQVSPTDADGRGRRGRTACQPTGDPQGKQPAASDASDRQPRPLHRSTENGRCAASRIDQKPQASRGFQDAAHTQEPREPYRPIHARSISLIAAASAPAAF